MMNVSIDSIVKLKMLKKVYYDTTRWIFYLILFGLFVHLDLAIQRHLMSVIHTDVLNLLNKLLSSSSMFFNYF